MIPEIIRKDEYPKIRRRYERHLQKMYSNTSLRHTIEVADWRYYNNPESSRDSPVMAVVVDDVGDIMGATSVINENYCYKGERVLLSWGVDLSVNQLYRGKGYGRELQSAMMNSVVRYVAHSMANSTRHIMEGAGARYIERCNIIVVPNQKVDVIINAKTRELLKARSRIRQLKAIFGVVIKYSLARVQYARYKHIKRNSYSIIYDDWASQESVNRHCGIKGNDHVRMTRVSNAKWRFVDSPIRRYRQLEIISGDIKYSVIYHIAKMLELNTVMIDDWAVPIIYDVGVRKELLSMLANHFKPMNVAFAMNEDCCRLDAIFRYPVKTYNTMLYTKEDWRNVKSMWDNMEYSILDQDIDR